MKSKTLLNRREVVRLCGMGLLASPLATVASCQKRRAPSFVEPNGAPFEGTDEQLLDEIQRASFECFWNEASPKTGQVKDRALANGNDSHTMSSIAATGFGLLTVLFALTFTRKVWQAARWPVARGRIVSSGVESYERCSDDDPARTVDGQPVPEVVVAGSVM